MEASNDQTIIHDAWPEDETPEPTSSKAYLIVVAGRGVGEMFSLDRGPKVIGRGGECDVVLFDNTVSRQHVRVEATPDGSVYITDLGSTNGTYVGDTRIESHQLRDGEKIRLGSTTILKFSYQDNIEQEFQKALRRGAIVDPLTGAYNRRFISDRLMTDFSHAQRHGRPLTLMLFDIDHFKAINDTYGHLAGDTVLVKLVDAVRPHLRKEDALGRYGGEEFIVLLRDTCRENARRLAERIRSVIAETPFQHEDKSISVTISIGVAALDDAEFKDPEDLLAAADTSLYAAKRGGRNRVACALVGGGDDGNSGTHAPL